MMKLIKLLLVIVFFYLSACKSDQKETIKTYKIDIHNLSHQNDMFENYHFVKLETTADNIIANIKKIEFYKKNIFILDSNSKALFIFDSIGNYIDRIYAFGRGYGEYLSADDFQLFNDTIYILSMQNKKIYVYDLNCDFVRDIALDDFCFNFHIVDDKHMYLFSEEMSNNGYNFAVFDYINKQYLNNLDPFGEPQYLCMSKTPFYKTKKGDVLIAKQFFNTIYSLKNDRYEPIYKFEFNTKDEMLDRYADMTKNDLYEELMKKSVVKRIDGIDVDDDRIYIYYDINFESIGYRTFVTIINNHNGTIRTCRLGDECDKKIPIIGHKIFLSKDYFVSYLPAIVAIDIDKSLELGMFKNEVVDETDNPILFFYKIK